MEITKQSEDEVYDAARTGCVESLGALLEKDPLILSKLSLTTKTETPLHVSALLGHLEFTKTLVAHNPKLAEGLNSFRRTPLHLASAGGHKETVQFLLTAYPDACLCPDDKGRIPLHYAAMRGEVEVLQELTQANPESVYLRVDNRLKETVLHLCVKYNRLECLKLLVQLVRDDGEFLNSKAGSDAGMTSLQLALMLGQIQTIRYLLSLAVIRAEANAVNGMSLIMLDVLEHSSIAREDFSNTLEIQSILRDAGIIRRSEINNENDHVPPPPAAAEPSPNPSAKKKKIRFLQTKLALPKKGAKGWWKILIKYLIYPKEKEWLRDTRGMLMVAATMVSTMTFEAVVNPPGGVWQQNNRECSAYPFCGEKECECIAGTTVLGNVWPGHFLKFIQFNTVSFLASLSVTVLLVSGFPLHNRLCLWLLSMAVSVTLTFMALTYLQVVAMVAPSVLFGTSYKMCKTSIRLWTGLLGVVGVMNTIRFLIWVVKKWRPAYFRAKSDLQKIISGSFSRKAPTDSVENVAARV